MRLIVNIFEEIPGQYLKNTFTRPKRDLVGTFISCSGIGCFQIVKKVWGAYVRKQRDHQLSTGQ